MVAFITKTKAVYSILDAVNNLHRLDISLLEGAGVERHSGRGDRLVARWRWRRSNQPKDEQIRHVLAFARPHYDWTVVDLGRSLSRIAHGRAWKRSTRRAW